MRGEALKDCGSSFTVEPRGAKRSKELPLDLGNRWNGLVFAHFCKKLIERSGR
jgi:hypothetical protein